MDQFPDKHFEAVLIPKQGNVDCNKIKTFFLHHFTSLGYFDIYITKAGTSQKVMIWSYATKMVGTDKFPETSSLLPIIRNVIEGKV